MSNWNWFDYVDGRLTQEVHREAEQALEILNSNRLIEKIIDKFDLYKHYELNKSEPFAHTYVVRMFKSNVRTKRNKFNVNTS